MHVELTLNGAVRVFDVAADASLLELLRDHAGITSPKDGCSPQGQCGACLVLVDGHPKTSCAIPARNAAGKSVLTLEGVPEGERRIYGEAFARTAGLQCGFCIPGIALRMKSVLDANANPTDEEIKRKLDPHLCRCTGYVKIVDAFHAAARLRRGEPLSPPDVSGRVGTSLDRYEAEELTLGDAALRRRPRLPRHAPRRRHALAARAGPREEDRHVEGGRPSRRDGDRHGARRARQALLRPDRRRLAGLRGRGRGDALRRRRSRRRRRRRRAHRPRRGRARGRGVRSPPARDRPRGGAASRAPRASEREGNLLSRSVVKRGDAEAALAASAHVVEGTWQTQRIEHLYLEPEACLAAPGDAAGQNPKARVTLYTQGQGIFDDRRQVAAFLGLSAGRGARRPRPERRRLRRQGGHVDPGADGAPGPRHGTARAPRPLARGVHAPPPETASHPDALPRRVRRRGPADRRSGPG